MRSTIGADTRILVAAKNVEDAKLATELLRQDFEHVFTTSDTGRTAQDFEQYEPDILVLAFTKLEEAERFYLGLYRLSHRARTAAHRTLILCQQSDTNRAFDLCHKQHFDDYVVFWPVSYDPQRLRMVALNAARAGASIERNGPSAKDFAAQTRRIAELETLLQRSLGVGSERIAKFSQSLSRVESIVGDALGSFSRDMIDGTHRDLVEVTNPVGFERELGRLRDVDMSDAFRAINVLLDPVRQWVETFKDELAPHLQSIRTLVEFAAEVRPVILIVDDDEFQRTVLREQLGKADLELELEFASSGTQALAMLRTLRPDLILMDYQLLDTTGVEVMQRLKLVPATAAIPVILITGTSTKQVLEASYSAGAVDFMVKPIDYIRLLDGIRRHLPQAAQDGHNVD